MAKDKSLGSNPVLAFHKKSKKEFINRSRATKSKLRDNQLQKRRPDQIQRQIDELRLLMNDGKINAQDRKNLDLLEKDMARMTKLRATGTFGPIITSERTKKDLHRLERTATKIPKDPTKSFYYDETFNPFGVPPPGMPYREKSPVILAENQYDSDVSTAASVSCIPMPPGSPPMITGANMTHQYDPLASPENAPMNSQTRIPERVPGDGGLSNRKQNLHRSDMPPGSDHDEAGGQVPQSQTMYIAAPSMRNLQQEAAQLVPKVMRRRRADTAGDPSRTSRRTSTASDEKSNANHTEVVIPSPEKASSQTPSKVRKRIDVAPVV